MLTFGIHVVQQFHRLIVLDESVINVRAGFIQQRLPVFGQLLARPDSLFMFMQIREIQLYQFGIIRSSSGSQNIGRDAHVYHIVVYHPVF